MKFLYSILIIFFANFSFAQTGIFKGNVASVSGEEIPLSKITYKTDSETKQITTDNSGNFSITLPSNEKIKIYVSAYFFKSKSFSIELEMNETLSKTIILRPEGVEITSKRDEPNIIELPVLTHELPSPTGNFEDVLKTQAGVSSTNELSSGYNVRGGNFDENLVYVNDIQIYRPFLARSGQQEGLSFINANLVESVRFSAGGFDAKYGDKLSSVLDIKYKRPYTSGGSFSGSLLGGNVHIEGISNNARFTYLTGVRYRSNGYVLNGLGTKGEYRPVFADVQSFFNYNITDLLEISFLGSIARNKYLLRPESRETVFGTFNQTLGFRVFFDGQEVSQYETYLGALSSTYKPNKKLELKFISSLYKTFEEESFDIEGQYFIGLVDNDPNSETSGEIVQNTGVGSFINHARNNLDAIVSNFSHKGSYLINNGEILWGVTAQYELINDKIREWQLIDSAGYSLYHPNNNIGYTDPNDRPTQTINLNSVTASKNNVESQRYSGFLQYSKRLYQSKMISVFDTIIESDRKVNLTLGARSQFWTYNQQNVISPRASISVKPRWYYLSEDSTITRRDINFRLSTGYYYQPPFYREFRDFNGNLNPDIRAQKSIHFVLGSDYIFNMWNRPFKYTVEAYYKLLEDVISYKVDNVRIKYVANNEARGYATGLDMKINGQFIEGVESWFTMSFLNTKEDIFNDRDVRYLNAAGDTINSYSFDRNVVDSTVSYPGLLRRPSNQFFNFGIFFQDHMPSHWNTEKINWESFKVYLALQYGTGLPFGPPNGERFQDVFTTPSYKRVDIGFSKELLVNRQNMKPNSFWQNFKSMSLTLEVFNLLDIKNTASYTWIKDVYNTQYPVPNHLTSRRLNVKLSAKF